jgi:hypothetical protein
MTGLFRGPALADVSGASQALAQRYDNYQPNRGLSRSGYEQMRQLAQQLDKEAHETNDAAQHAQYSIYRRDTTFRRAVSSFARRADQFNYRLGAYTTRPWQVDDELRGMLRAAQDVQYRVQNSRYMDERVVGEWSEVINVLNRMREVYRADLRGEYGRYGNPQPYGNPPNGNPSYRGDYAPPGARRRAATAIPETSWSRSRVSSTIAPRGRTSSPKEAADPAGRSSSERSTTSMTKPATSVCGWNREALRARTRSAPKPAI